MSGTIPVCLITGSLRNLAGVTPGNLTTLAASLYIKNEQSFLYKDNLIAPFEISQPFDVSGNVALTCMETQTPGAYLQIFVTLEEALSLRTILMNPAIIPSTQAGWLFTITTPTTCAVGDTYKDNGGAGANTYTVLQALTAQSGQVLYMSGTAVPVGSTLGVLSGSGTSSIAFTSELSLSTIDLGSLTQVRPVVW